jgi:hypothetical protein
MIAVAMIRIFCVLLELCCFQQVHVSKSISTGRFYLLFLSV